LLYKHKLEKLLAKQNLAIFRFFVFIFYFFIDDMKIKEKLQWNPSRYQGQGRFGKGKIRRKCYYKTCERENLRLWEASLKTRRVYLAMSSVC
jgi:hypothetical protein